MLRYLFLGAVLLVAYTVPAVESAHQFLWEQANAQSMGAAQPEEYLRAATTYNRLVLGGVRNGALLCNLGGALVMGGDGVNAEAAFERAERYLGTTPEIRQGLTAARSLRHGTRWTEQPWSRVAFFWHYAPSCHARALAALAGWTIVWLGVLLRFPLRREGRHLLCRSLSEACFLSGGLLFAVFTASVTMTIIHEQHDRATWPNRVFTSAAPGNGEEAP